MMWTVTMRMLLSTVQGDTGTNRVIYLANALVIIQYFYACAIQWKRGSAGYSAIGWKQIWTGNRFLVCFTKTSAQVMLKIVYHASSYIFQLQWYFVTYSNSQQYWKCKWHAVQFTKVAYYWSWVKQKSYIMDVAIFFSCSDITSATLEANSSASAVDMWYGSQKVMCDWVTQTNWTPYMLLSLAVAVTKSQLLWRATVLQVEWTRLFFLPQSGKGPSRCLSYPCSCMHVCIRVSRTVI